jgi:hypothetical protein
MLVKFRMQRLLAPWMAWWLALAVVLAPALGRMHEVLHAPLLPERHAPQAVPHAHQHAHHDEGEENDRGQQSISLRHQYAGITRPILVLSYRLAR